MKRGRVCRCCSNEKIIRLVYFSACCVCAVAAVWERAQRRQCVFIFSPNISPRVYSHLRSHISYSPAQKNASGWCFEKGSITLAQEKAGGLFKRVESGPFGACGDRYILIFSSPTTAAAAALGRMIRVISRSRAFCPAAGINKTTVTLETNKIASRCVSLFSYLSRTSCFSLARAQQH